MNYHFPNTLLVYLHDLLQRYRVLFDLRIVCENDMIKDTPSEAELQQVQNTVGGLVVVETDLLDRVPKLPSMSSNILILTANSLWPEKRTQLLKTKTMAKAGEEQGKESEKIMEDEDRVPTSIVTRINWWYITLFSHV